MDTNNLALNSISSNYLKSYLIETKHRFSPYEQLVLIYNSDICLNTKINMYQHFKGIYDNEIEELVNLLISDTTNVLDELNTIYNRVILFNSENKGHSAIATLDTLKSILIIENDILIENKISILRTSTGEKLYDVELNDDLAPIRFKSNRLDKKLNRYINLQTGLNIGDKVKLPDDDNQYVVVSLNDVPDELIDTASFSKDEIVIVIPENCLNLDIDYKNQIEDLLKDRIHKIDIEDSDIIHDIISDNQEIIHKTLIEKV